MQGGGREALELGLLVLIAVEAFRGLHVNALQVVGISGGFNGHGDRQLVLEQHFHVLLVLW